ncbi:hypothetical protein [Micromonospora sp. DH14]|uniref:hypothetical protein n=1 Tax=Micromonospora sp. DH14 TaxID=3040120 RepID=UPI002440FA07|nr:hypothetical protein [Micromonospora sp. DH14]MDG9679042.1 hypothetical protein [Micromonospora sp. DH14]
MASEYTAINVSHGARDELRSFAAAATGTLGQRVTMTDALRLAVRIATAHLAADATATATALGITGPTRKAD